jgi:hypothetical protein
VFYCGYCVSIGCVFGNVLLSVLWRVFGEYLMCVFGKVSLSALWRVLGGYCMFV